MTPPWSRRRATQPASVTVVPASAPRRVPDSWDRITGSPSANYARRPILSPQRGGHVLGRGVPVVAGRGDLLAGADVLDLVAALGRGAGREPHVGDAAALGVADLLAELR